MRYKPLPADMSKWQIVERPDYLGSAATRKIDELDEKYGKENWLEVWVTGKDLHWDDSNPRHGILGGRFLILDFEKQCRLYELSYMKYFLNNLEELFRIVDNFEEVYDNAESNILSGLNYLEQGEESTHIQDIAVRNVVKKQGLKFKGKGLLQIRFGKEGACFAPNNIPYFNSDLIMKPPLSGWWDRGVPFNVELAYQSNKLIAEKQ